MESNTLTPSKKSVSLTPETLREHWQGHRRLTRKLIVAYPDDQLFTHSVGGMRPFSDLIMEMVEMTKPGIAGIVTGDWNTPVHEQKYFTPSSKDDLLKLWDETTQLIDDLWPQVTAERLLEVDTAFGQWEDALFRIVFYWIDNEIHHRGQAYVYFRSLGIQPPAFWDRM